MIFLERRRAADSKKKLKGKKSNTSDSESSDKNEKEYDSEADSASDGSRHADLTDNSFMSNN